MNYNRVLLKLSGEVLGGVKGHGIDPDAASYFTSEIRKIHEAYVQIGIVIGGGNIYRGAAGTAMIDRVSGDQMGMLATVINALALRDYFEKAGMATKIMGPAAISPMMIPFDRKQAVELLDQGNVLIFAGGTGNPYFTTDSAAALRAAEIDADLLLKGTKVDGVYSADPVKDPGAKRYERISYDQVITQQLKVMDLSAMTLCRENTMPVIVFNFTEPGTLYRILSGEEAGTIIEE
jgi:uridylate kinase